MAAIPRFPPPDQATQNILGIQGPATHLNDGGFKSVYACTLVSDGTAAVVSVSRGPEQAAEAAVLSRLASQPPHPHIVWVRCRHDVGDLTYAVSARLHVDLFDEVIGVLPGVLPEATARAHFTQILSGLRHMHRLGVAHRDIKLENIMISQQGVVRLLDFGLSVVVPAQPPPGPVFVNTQGNGQRGSQSYMAPEVFASGPGGPSYNIYAAEVWSLGCVLFAMSAGFFFVDSATRDDPRFRRAQRAQQNGLSTVGAMYNMYARPNPLGANLVALLDGMLCINPAERMTLDDVCNSPWVSAVGAAVFAHDTVVPLAPALWRLRTQLRWARLRRPTQLANAFLRALVDQAEIRADLRPGGPGMRAAQAEFEETAPVYDSLPDRFPEAASPCYRSLSGAEASSPVYRGGPVVTSFEELEAEMEKEGVPRVEPPPLTRQKAVGV